MRLLIDNGCRNATRKAARPTVKTIQTFPFPIEVPLPEGVPFSRALRLADELALSLHATSAYRISSINHLPKMMVVCKGTS